MRKVSDAMKTSLKKSPSTLCNCWIVVRTDGEVLGFTEHDRELIVAGEVCEPSTGFNASTTEESSGLAGDSSDVLGALSSDRIAERDLLNGFYDGARIERYLVDWAEADTSMLLSRAILGEVTIENGSFSAELRSVSSLLDRSTTRYFSRMCDANLGDERCGVDMSVAGRRASATIVAHGAHHIDIDVVTRRPILDFNPGRLKLDDGSDRRFQIASLQEIKPGRWRIEVHARVGKSIPAGANCSVEIGCDKLFSTCCNTFNNAAAFRGFPHIPGSNKALGYPEEDGVFDGGPLVP
ncbi:MAG: DUF2163 domain-containing protein [Pseudomonadota bacterium]